MADRITLPMVERALAVFAREMGTETYDEAKKNGHPIVGTYTLHVQRLEGFRIRIERITSDRMTVTEPFGSQVRNAREMYEAIHFGINLVREQRAMERVMAERIAGLTDAANASPANVAANAMLADVDLE